MSSTVEELEPGRVKLTIDVPFSELEPAIDKAYKEIANQVNIPGFRRGKVPPALIDQRFGRGVVLQEAINDVLPQTYAAAIEENELYPMAQPDIDVTELNDGENVIFTAEVDVRPQFEVADLSDLEIEVPTSEVTDEEVNERIDLLRERFATVTEVDRAAKEGDLVVVNLTASQDGEVLDDAESEGVQYKLGAGGMVDGFDENVTGMKAGETKSFTSTLVGGANRGEEAEIEVEVTKVSEQQLPDVDDEFAQMVSEFDTAEEMIEDIRDNLVRLARIDQANQAREKVLDALIDNTEFELPSRTLEAENTNRRQAIEQQLAQAGIGLQEYLDQTGEAESEEEFWTSFEQQTERAIRSQLILDKIAEGGNFEVTQEDLTQLLFTKAQQSGHSPEQELQHMMEHNHTQEWMAEITRGKALGEIVNRVTIKDVDGNVLDLALLQADGTYMEATDDEDAAPKLEGELIEETQPEAEESEVVAEEKPAKKPATKKSTSKKAKAKADDAEAKPDDE